MQKKIAHYELECLLSVVVTWWWFFLKTSNDTHFMKCENNKAKSDDCEKYLEVQILSHIGDLFLLRLVLWLRISGDYCREYFFEADIYP